MLPFHLKIRKEGTGVNIEIVLSKFRVDSYSFQQGGHFAV